MTFFENQIRAKQKTKLLVFYFFCAVVLIILVIFAGLTILLSKNFDPELLLLVSIASVSVISLGSLYKILVLRSGGKKVAESLGGKLLNETQANLQETKLLNIVQEMAIASGIPVPPVYLINEVGINAFAAGYTVDNAVIGITKGSLEILNRDELQGVIAHEFSHILNGDMRLNIRLIGILHGILIIGITGYYIFRGSFSRRSYNRDRESGTNASVLIVGLLLCCVGYIGVFFGNLIKAAVSRQREFLADATAVQFTRNPDGISGALKKIGGYVEGSQIHNPHAEEVSHLFFSNAFKKSFFHLFATHPPLLKRIKKIDPSFKGQFTYNTAVSTDPSTSRSESISHLQTPQSVNLTPQKVIEQVGTVSKESILRAKTFFNEFDKDQQDACLNKETAPLVIFSILVEKEDSIASKQKKILHENNIDLEEFEKVLEMTRIFSIKEILPIIDLCIPTLRMLSKEEYLQFKDLIRQMAIADEQISLFEYMLHHILLRHVERIALNKTIRLKQSILNKHVTTLFGAVAQNSNTLLAEQQKAYIAAYQYYFHDEALLPEKGFHFTISELDDALITLENVSPQIKEQILGAIVIAIREDGIYNEEEMQILRVIGDALRCPMPLVFS